MKLLICITGHYLQHFLPNPALSTRQNTLINISARTALRVETVLTSYSNATCVTDQESLNAQSLVFWFLFLLQSNHLFSSSNFIDAY